MKIGGIIDGTFSYDSPTGQGGFHESDTVNTPYVLVWGASIPFTDIDASQLQETRPAAQAPQQTAAVSTNIHRAEALPQVSAM